MEQEKDSSVGKNKYSIEPKKKKSKNKELEN